MPLVSDVAGDAPLKFHQDVNIYTLALDGNKEMAFTIEKGRLGYLVQIEGSSDINSIEVCEREASEIVEEKIAITTKQSSHFILLEMKKEII